MSSRVDNLMEREHQPIRLVSPLSRRPLRQLSAAAPDPRPLKPEMAALTRGSQRASVRSKRRRQAGHRNRLGRVYNFARSATKIARPPVGRKSGTRQPQSVHRALQDI
jgi:hypothetical protein